MRVPVTGPAASQLSQPFRLFLMLILKTKTEFESIQTKKKVRMKTGQTESGFSVNQPIRASAGSLKPHND